MAKSIATVSSVSEIMDGFLDLVEKLKLVKLFAAVVKELPELHKDVDKVIMDVEKILAVLQETTKPV